ncbi:Holliday junction resolvase RuvX, partial [Escherichia coli]
MPDVNVPQTIMAFDFGTQKMGMSVGQSLIASANPLPLFPMKDGIP